MALKKETILVWFSTQKEGNQNAVSLLCYPAARKKDLISRISTAAAKKVKGNRLEGLDYHQIDEMNASFVSEYVSSLFRIASLKCFTALYARKSPILEEEVGCMCSAHACAHNHHRFIHALAGFFQCGRDQFIDDVVDPVFLKRHALAAWSVA